jgi:methylthioribose-1-phosphate isomerase
MAKTFFIKGHQIKEHLLGASGAAILTIANRITLTQTLGGGISGNVYGTDIAVIRELFPNLLVEQVPNEDGLDKFFVHSETG